MYAYFIGQITYIDTEHVIIETGGIGYNIVMPASDISLLTLGLEAKIYTYTSVREDAFVLYGFLDMEELRFFKLLLSVNGIGPKAAISILSNTTIDDLIVAIVAQDTKSISKVPGIGAKTAGRIILDLKDKVSTEDILSGVAGNSDTTSGSAINRLKSEATEALAALGYSQSEAMRVVNKIEITEDMEVQAVIRAALMNM